MAAEEEERNELPTVQENPESAIPDEYNHERLNSTGLNCEINRNFYECSSGTRNKRNILRDTVIEDSFNIVGRDLNTWSLMYIDDLNIGEVHAQETAVRHYTQNKELSLIHI